MPPARGRGRRGRGRGRGSARGASPARATRASVRLNQSEVDPADDSVGDAEKTEAETATASGSCEADGNHDNQDGNQDLHDNNAAEPSGLDGEMSSVGASASNTGQGNSGAVDAGEIRDSQLKSCGSESDIILSGTEISIHARDSDMMADTETEVEDIEIVTESESLADESGNQNEATEIESMCETDFSAAVSASDSQEKGDVVDAELSVPPGELVESEMDGVETTSSTVQGTTLLDADVTGDEMDTSLADGHFVVMDSVKGDDDIDDLIVIDDGESEEENMKDADTKDTNITDQKRDSQAKKGSSGTEQNKKNNLEKKSVQSKSEEKKTSTEQKSNEKGDHIWQVRVYPVNLETMREQKDTWSELCSMAVIAEYRMTKGLQSRGQIDLQQTTSGMFQFLVKGPSLHPLIRQLMRVQYDMKQVRMEMRRLTLKKSRDVKSDVHILHDVLGEVMYHKEDNKRDRQKGVNKTRHSGGSQQGQKKQEKSEKGQKVDIRKSETDKAKCAATDVNVQTSAGGKSSVEMDTDKAGGDTTADGAENVCRSGGRTQAVSSDPPRDVGSGDRPDGKQDEESASKSTQHLQQVSSGAAGESVKGNSQDHGGTAETTPTTETTPATDTTPATETDSQDPSNSDGIRRETAATVAATDEPEMYERKPLHKDVIIERGDAVCFRLQLESAKDGLRHLRDGLKIASAAKDGKVPEECQLFLKNLSNSVCDETIEAVFPFARMLERRKGDDDDSGMAIFETCSEKETKRYLNAYYKIFVNYKPVYISSGLKKPADPPERPNKNQKEQRTSKSSSGAAANEKKAAIKRPAPSEPSSGGASKKPKMFAQKRRGSRQQGVGPSRVRGKTGGHYGRGPPVKPAGKTGERLQCRNCLQEGHFTLDCPLPQQRQVNMLQQAEKGARQLEELYTRVAETQRKLSTIQQHAQMGMGDGGFPQQLQHAAQFGGPLGGPGVAAGGLFGGPGGMGGGHDPRFGVNMGGPLGSMMGAANFGQPGMGLQNQRAQAQLWQQQRR